jgi:hypothetical protein
VSAVQIQGCNLQFRLLYLKFHLSNYLLYLQILLPKRYLLKPQLQPYLYPNLRASYLRTNGNGYKTLIEPWRLYRWIPASAVESMDFQWT